MNKFRFILSAILFFSLANTSTINAKQKRQNFKIVASTDFAVRYSTAVTVEEVKETVTLFQQAFSKLNDEFSFKSAQKPSIVLHGTVLDFINATGNPGWHGGVTQGNTITLEPPSVLKEKGVLKTTIFHEAAHYFISAVTHGNCPAWLQEGFAVYFSGELKGMKDIEMKIFSSFDEISHLTAGTKSRRRATAAYITSSLMVRTLINKYGSKKLLFLFRVLGTGSSFSSACKKSYGIPQEQLFKILSARRK